jgi:hypothetical protein
VSREIVLCCANRATPSFESKIDLAMRVQYRLALFAKYWLVFDNRQIFDFFKWRVDCTHWQHYACLRQFVGWPVVPGEPEAVLEFSLIEIHISNVLLIIPTRNLLFFYLVTMGFWGFGVLGFWVRV